MIEPRHRRATAAAKSVVRWAVPVAIILVVSILILSLWRGAWDFSDALPFPTLRKGVLLDEFLLLPLSAVGAGIGLTLVTTVAAILLVHDHRPWGAILVVLSVACARLASSLAKSAFEAPRPNAVVVDSLKSPEITMPIILAVGTLFAVSLLTRWRWIAVIAAITFAALVGLGQIAAALVPIRHGLDSFPSGHAVGSGAFVFSLVLVLWRSPRLRFRAIALGGFFVVGVGVSRLYLREHYPADVIAGWALAILCVVATVGVVYAVRAIFERAAERQVGDLRA